MISPVPTEEKLLLQKTNPNDITLISLFFISKGLSITRKEALSIFKHTSTILNIRFPLNKGIALISNGLELYAPKESKTKNSFYP
ncbi:hypothetical protein CLAVI_000999 [Candidatus Clavichlamydia salmonicola]|uniref:hypothetical protein n=1 Tax=Candidatus Clavichlamydia salmonicola TaxID=469812 RepID=UPI0018916798|nr:hypothetical protein [Candidatus Clavichlamydia salmonicola]MBF5051356.1 hypothetical protein [Candidatus Clavichlamydia salmonicola]